MEVKKSKKASLESKRFLFFKAGLLFSLAIVFCSFELRFYGLEVSDLEGIEWEDEIELELDAEQIIIPKKKVVPPRPKVQFLDLSKKLEVLPDDVSITDTDPMTFDEIDDLHFGDLEEEGIEGDVTNLDLSGVFDMLELSDKPKFGNRDKDLDLYIKSKLNLRATGIYGKFKVDVSFVVEKDGSVSDVKLYNTKGLPYGVLKDIKGMFDTMPNWSPGRYGSKAVRTQLVKPINIVFEG